MKKTLCILLAVVLVFTATVAAACTPDETPAPGSDVFEADDEMRLVIADFEYNLDRHGNPYGWGVARYTAPETLYGPLIADCTPAESFVRIRDHFRTLFPEASDRQMLKLIG